MPSYKLIYFTGRGRAEIIRLMFAAAGVQYEDCRMTWEEFKKLPDGGSFPFGKLPVLEVDDKMISCSFTILKFVARETGFSPKDSFQIAKADMIVDEIDDWIEKFSKAHREKDEEVKKSSLKTFYEKYIPDELAKFEKLLKSNGGKYFAENRLTYADVVYYSMVQASFYEESKEGVPSVLDAFPLLKDLYDRVANNPGIKEWVNKRPETRF